MAQGGGDEPDVDHRDEPVLDDAALGAVRQVMAAPMMTQLVEVMERTSRETMKLLVERLAADDLAMAQRAAHKLKGSAGNLGLRRLWRLSTNIEAAPDIAAARQLAAELPELLETSLSAIRSATEA